MIGRLEACTTRQPCRENIPLGFLGRSIHLGPSVTMLFADLLPRRFPNFFELSVGASVTSALRYLIFAGIAWLFCYVIFRRAWFHRKVVMAMPKRTEIQRELLYSALTVAIFGLVGAATILITKTGATQMYRKMSAFGPVWFWVSIGCTIILHDTYFYWTHRLMHHPRLFKWFHRVHHLSHNPSPWASYAFSPLEAFVQAGIFPLTVFLIPIHPLAFGIFMIWQIVFNVAGHTGYEFHPKWLMDSWLGRILNTPTNHAMHHEKIRGNYGLYFNVWDRLMGTNHPEYEDRFREVTTRPKTKANQESAPMANTEEMRA